MPSEDAHTNNDITLGLLDAVYAEKTLSQRRMAQELGIALGLVNSYVKRCIRKGWVKVNQVSPNRVRYYLTPQGMAEKTRLTAEYFSQSLQLYRVARNEGERLFALCETRGWRRVALFGSGDLIEIIALSGLEFDGIVRAIIPYGKARTKPVGLDVTADCAELRTVDAVIICELIRPMDAYEFATTEIDAARILAPAFLKLPNATLEPHSLSRDL